MIVGIGTDVVDIERFKWMVRRTPAALDRMLRRSEQVYPDGSLRRAESLAARFAAKEAVAKALGSSLDVVLAGCEIASDAAGVPTVRLAGEAAAAAEAAGITTWHLSMSHDGPVAMAFVVAEAR